MDSYSETWFMTFCVLRWVQMVAITTAIPMRCLVEISGPEFTLWNQMYPLDGADYMVARDIKSVLVRLRNRDLPPFPSVHFS